MLNENIRNFRKSKGLSQEELAEMLNVTRQTVSKWETGLSVPDADRLIALSEAYETPVSVLLGETVEESQPDELRALAEKLELVNLQLAKSKDLKRKKLHLLFTVLCVLIPLVAVALAVLESPYLGWNLGDPETAVFAAVCHTFEFVFVRAALPALIVSIVGLVLTRKKGTAA